MQVIYSDTHRKHHPSIQIFGGGEKVPSFESPERLDSIVTALTQTDWAELRSPEEFGLEHIQAVHAPDYVDYLQNAFKAWTVYKENLGETSQNSFVMSDTFPPRRSNRRPTSIVAQAGYYSFDLCCPIGVDTYEIAVTSANCALTGAKLLQTGETSAFALCRPPGHHAGRDFAGGYCYLNNVAIAAKYLSAHGKVAILDIDYHAGNGTQDIFYSSSDVLTISIHADPALDYPYFVGYADETGEDSGQGYHHNFPLPLGTGDEAYFKILEKALELVKNFMPEYLLVSYGADTFQSDPLGSFAITTEGLQAIGFQITSLNLPTLIVMEGGYNIESLGLNTCAMLTAFAQRA
jgi:acetoin utilization deacetylase AcuC-like enzyme